MKLIINGRDFTSLCVGLTLEDNVYSSAASLTGCHPTLVRMAIIKKSINNKC